TQALAGAAVTVYGDGSQTRSLCYAGDLVDGLLRLDGCDYTMPVNLGNPHEITIDELAGTVIRLCESASEVTHHALPEDDPRRRCPDVSVARSVLGWEPAVQLEEGLLRTIDWWRGKG